ncbi:MAG: tetratricopeptide repeat protein [Hyphomicrobiaceae bacterium]|nr:tetratricopeptide repeat protein [Hyphomicrobiaceae bacterium]
MSLATLRALSIASLSLLAGACAQGGLSPPSLATLLGEKTDTGSITTASTPPPAKAGATPEEVRAELQRATDYWGAEYIKKPTDAQAALNYARNLKALGEKQQAMGVLQAAYENNSSHKGIMGELGRLSLEFDQITLAKRLLEQADDPANSDWRVISARGTVLAKQGLFAESIPYYERALKVSPDQPSVLNNLAMAYTMGGQPDKAEPLLRRASAAPKADERVAANLALVRSLQGNDEAAPAATADAAKPTRPAAAAPTKAAAAKPIRSAWSADVYAQQ